MAKIGYSLAKMNINFGKNKHLSVRQQGYFCGTLTIELIFLFT
ncbi:hypothetical protein AsAng_0020730 [Aureispira anguillae]|uniref:Uncharacterized protein n=1 Tax=Aureispira anguillae TaxID=2864201 RepID=A0A916DRM9_9BACT|nr:hypothetical protein AsAng_0020730 [Aureispira anguillae]